MLRLFNPMFGAVKHSISWLSSGSTDLFIPNKNFAHTSTSQTVIYCIHGTADRRSSFGNIAATLSTKLPDNIVGIHLLTFDSRLSGSSITEYAKQLKNKIILNKDNHVILMGHSRGCLVASWFAEYLAEVNGIQVDDIISICGPFKGSYAAKPLGLLGNSVKEMKPDSEFLKDLSAKIKNSQSHYFYIGAKKDSLVTGDSYFPYGCEAEEYNTFVCENHGHLSVMSSNKLTLKINEHIHEHVDYLKQSRAVTNNVYAV